VIRRLSHSEVATALDCQVKHAFAYTGHLTDGDSLKGKSTAPQLREGKAWGAAVAAWHATGAVENAEVALAASLSLDAAEQQSFGVYDAGEHARISTHLAAILADYVTDAERIPIDRLEHELEVAIPSRTGLRDSNRYRLTAFLDGVHTDTQGRDWIVEFKLRKQFQSFDLIAKSRQLRWYAWAWHKTTGRHVAGIILEERLNAVPAEVKLNKNGSLSKVQSCRPDTYTAAGGDDPDVLAKLQHKRWSQRHTLLLTDFELREAGLQLASAGSLIQQLDAGALYPLRNPSPMRCPGCAFREVCVDPGDTELVDALFERRIPKREKEEVAHAA
jgi:hypothetical protein